MKENKNSGLKVLLIIIILSIFLFIPINIAWNYMVNNSIYRIGKITEIEYIGKSSTNRVRFTYFDSKGRCNFKDDSTKIYLNNIGKRFIVKMSNKDWINSIFFTYKLYLDKPVPDSVRPEPKEGWKTLPSWVR